jgi:predicted RNA-binding Zn-ribbon protein involved in translation (DUF1610 family)
MYFEQRSPAVQILMSMLVGPPAAIAIGLAYVFLIGLCSATLPSWLGPAGSMCILPVLVCVGSFVAGLAVRDVAGKRLAIVKGLLATPAWYLVLFALAAAVEPEGLAVFAGMVIPSWLFTCLGVYVGRKKHVAELPPTCMHCGYNLTGNVTGTCPECGERIIDLSTEDRPPDDEGQGTER